ncbi:MAG: hypothetical protein R2942_02540 [Ignavibacteria bacterium]
MKINPADKYYGFGRVDCYAALTYDYDGITTKDVTRQTKIVLTVIRMIWKENLQPGKTGKIFRM